MNFWANDLLHRLSFTFEKEEKIEVAFQRFQRILFSCFEWPNKTQDTDSARGKSINQIGGKISKPSLYQ